jgi:hypothetical protein
MDAEDASHALVLQFGVAVLAGPASNQCSARVVKMHALARGSGPVPAAGPLVIGMAGCAARVDLAAHGSPPTTCTPAALRWTRLIMALSSSPDNVSHFMADTQRTHTHEVLRAGVLGATVVWFWILIIGALSGSPFRLATLLGRGITHIVGVPSNVPTWIAVIVFTALHFIAWCGLAEIMAIVLRVAVRTPAVLLLTAVVTILFLLGFFGITLIFANDGLGGFAWPSIYLGNVVGLAAMGWYIVHWHPEIRTELAHAHDDR